MRALVRTTIVLMLLVCTLGANIGHAGQTSFNTRSTYPPHHSLWLCIHGLEAIDWFNKDTGHNGHYGGLQMHYNWGYGIVGFAYNYTQPAQEWAAERGFIASHFSTRWLMGQWYHPSCLRYT